MALTLLFLGRLADVAGAPERECEVDAGETLAALLAGLEPDLAAALTSPQVRVAVNGLILDRFEIPLRDGDEIAFLPPVSGG